MAVPDLTAAFNKKFGLGKTATAIRSTLKNYKIICGRSHKERIYPAQLYTSQEIAFMKEHYTGSTVEDLRIAFNRKFNRDMTWQQIRSAVHNRGFINGRDGRFEKGHRPWNCGTKGLVKPNSGNFKKGQTPKNTKPIGAERITKDGFIEIKIRERNPYTGCETRFKHKHVHLWEQLHGPVPEGFCVFFRDSNKLNLAPDNLILISRAELVRLNYANYREVPQELKPSVLALSKLKSKIGEIKRNAHRAVKRMVSTSPGHDRTVSAEGYPSTARPDSREATAQIISAEA